MKQEELFAALDGMFAYDEGCTDSGIKSETLKEEVKEYLRKNDDAERQLLIFIHTHYDPENGYTIEDVCAFIDWLRDEMDLWI